MLRVMTESQRPLASGSLLAVTGLARENSSRGLLQVLPGIVGEDADDPGGHNGRSDAKDADKWLNFRDLANDFGLELLLVGDIFGEEELILLISGQLPLIGEQAEKAGCNCCPDNEQYGYSFHSGHSGSSAL